MAGRPKLKAAQKRVACSISVRKDIDALAGKTANKSRFYETSVECSKALTMAIEDFRKDRIALEDLFEQLEDVADIWTASFEKAFPFERTTAKTIRAAVRRKSNTRRASA